VKRIGTWMNRLSPNRYVSHQPNHQHNTILTPSSFSPNPQSHQRPSHNPQITHNHDPLSITERPARGETSPLQCQRSPYHYPSILPSAIIRIRGIKVNIPTTTAGTPPKQAIRSPELNPYQVPNRSPATRLVAPPPTSSSTPAVGVYWRWKKDDTSKIESDGG
jgi:hypothetical protein